LHAVSPITEIRDNPNSFCLKYCKISEAENPFFFAKKTAPITITTTTTIMIARINLLWIEFSKNDTSTSFASTKDSINAVNAEQNISSMDDKSRSFCLIPSDVP